MAEQQANKYNLRNIVEAFSIIEHLVDTNGKIGLVHLTKYTGLTKNKTFRILTTLEALGIIKKDPHGNYTFAPTAFILSHKILAKIRLLETVELCMDELRNRINETVYFAYSEPDGQLLLLNCADCHQKVKVTPLIGRSIMAESKCLATFSDITVEVGGIDPHVTIVMAKIGNHSTHMQGALVVVAPSFRMPMSRINAEIAPALWEILQRFSLPILGKLDTSFNRQRPSLKPQRPSSKRPHFSQMSQELLVVV